MNKLKERNTVLGILERSRAESSVLNEIRCLMETNVIYDMLQNFNYDSANSESSRLFIRVPSSTAEVQICPSPAIPYSTDVIVNMAQGTRTVYNLVELDSDLPIFVERKVFDLE